MGEAHFLKAWLAREQAPLAGGVDARAGRSTGADAPSPCGGRAGAFRVSENLHRRRCLARLVPHSLAALRIAAVSDRVVSRALIALRGRDWLRHRYAVDGAPETARTPGWLRPNGWAARGKLVEPVEPGPLHGSAWVARAYRMADFNLAKEPHGPGRLWRVLLGECSLERNPRVDPSARPLAASALGARAPPPHPRSL
jgi:hypothetical protein